MLHWERSHLAEIAQATAGTLPAQADVPSLLESGDQIDCTQLSVNTTAHLFMWPNAISRTLS